MKRLFTIIITSLFSINAFAAFIGPGTASANTVYVKQAMTLADDSFVTLEGSIVKQTEHEHYLFKDETGEIIIEVSERDFRDITVTPEDKIKIVGEIDKDWNNIKLDVKQLKLIKVL